MTRYLAVRLYSMALTLLGLTLLIFLMLRLIPGTVVEQMIGADAVASPAMVAELKRFFGLDQPWYMQLWIFVREILTFDFGKSWITREQVSSIFLSRLPATLTITIPILLLEAALAIPGVEKFVSSQPQYSLLHRSPERSLIPLSAGSGISQIVWSPLAQGVLTGKYLPGGNTPPDSRAANDAINGFLNQEWLQPKVLEAVQALRPLAARAGLTLAQFALAWVLRQPDVAAAITGASRPEQVDENAAASGRTVAPELFEKAERIIDLSQT